MPIQVLGFAGSLRKASFNRMLLQAAVGLAPEGMTIETAVLDDIPLYNQDVNEQGYPPPVDAFRKRIKEADALLIATPEYNYSIPGVLKNAIDWFSRPPDPPLEGKPTAIMGAGLAMIGTARAQFELRHVAVYTNMHMVNKPEVLVNSPQTKFNEAGELTDEKTKETIAKLLVNLKYLTAALTGKS